MKDKIALLAIEYYSQFDSFHRDIMHTQEVVTYTRLIAKGEGLSEVEACRLEAAAWLHDIGCPISRKLFGNALPVNQQREGKIITLELLKDIDSISEDDKLWLAEVVATHHQHPHAIKLQFMPLFEADLIVNFLSGEHPKEKATHFFDTLMQSESGKRLFKLLVK